MLEGREQNIDHRQLQEIKLNVKLIRLISIINLLTNKLNPKCIMQVINQARTCRAHACDDDSFSLISLINIYLYIYLFIFPQLCAIQCIVVNHSMNSNSTFCRRIQAQTNTHKRETNIVHLNLMVKKYKKKIKF